MRRLLEKLSPLPPPFFLFVISLPLTLSLTKTTNRFLLALLVAFWEQWRRFRYHCKGENFWKNERFFLLPSILCIYFHEPFTVEGTFVPRHRNDFFSLLETTSTETVTFFFFLFFFSLKEKRRIDNDDDDPELSYSSCRDGRKLNYKFQLPPSPLKPPTTPVPSPSLSSHTFQKNGEGVARISLVMTSLPQTKFNLDKNVRG